MSTQLTYSSADLQQASEGTATSIGLILSGGRLLASGGVAGVVVVCSCVASEQLCARRKLANDFSVQLIEPSLEPPSSKNIPIGRK